MHFVMAKSPSGAIESLGCRRGHRRENEKEREAASAREERNGNK